ncbi:hypothetical protein DL93DRAFT_2126859 [Clavulina sp. PMI_390]|nr:hypothetical protein DL93DRAFT_2126859 [Clavulina sp. PMI_390]
MFQLTTMKDKIAVAPHMFGMDPEDALEIEVNKKYANRIVFDVGLAICVFDFLKIGEGIVHYGDGCYWYTVTFRIVVFRPFVSEVILAKVRSCDPEKIHLSLGFFDDITIPKTSLPPGSAFDPNQQLFFFHPEGEELSATELLDTPKEQRNYIHPGVYMRVRIQQELFSDDEPGPPEAVEGAEVVKERAKPPYSITCSIAEQGLGVLAWWAEDEEMADGEIEMV